MQAQEEERVFSQNREGHFGNCAWSITSLRSATVSVTAGLEQRFGFLDQVAAPGASGGTPSRLCSPGRHRPSYPDPRHGQRSDSVFRFFQPDQNIDSGDPGPFRQLRHRHHHLLPRLQVDQAAIILEIEVLMV